MPDDLDNDDQDQSSESSVLRDLRKKVKEQEDAAARAAELEAELNNVRRQAAFEKAGLDLDGNKLHAMAASQYDGELNADAIKAYANELGLTSAQSPTTPAPPASELEQFGQVGAQMAGGDVPPPPPSEMESYEKAFAALPKGIDTLSTLQNFGEWLQARGGDVTDEGPQGTWENQIIR